MNLMNIKYNFLLFVVIVFSLFLGCTSEYNTLVRLEATGSKTINLGKTYKIIQLDTSKSCFLEYINKAFIDFNNNRIFILSDWNLYFFDTNGKYLNQLKIGRGPGEITMATNFSVLQEHKKVFVLNNSNRIFTFNYDGEYIDDFDINNFYSLDLQVLDEENILLNCNSVSISGYDFFVGLYNLKENKVIKQFIHKDNSPYPINVFITQHNFKIYEGKIYFSASNIFGLFEFKDDDFERIIDYDLGHRAVPASFASQFQGPGKRQIFQDEAKRNNYVPFISHSFPFKNYYMVIIDDKNRSCYAIDRKNFSKVYLNGQLSDYFDLPKIRSLRRPAAIQDGFIVFAAQPLDFFGPDPVEKSKTIEIAGKTLQINYDDNPFLVLVE